MDKERVMIRRPVGEHRRRPLEGRIALVTGGAAGIGRGIAQHLLRAGAVVTIGDLVESTMEEACRELAADGPVDWVKLDVADHESREAGLATIRDRHGDVEILVNNAGIATPGLFDEEDPHRIRKELMVDLVGAICLTRSVLPGMVKKKWGRIANISSMMAFTGTPGFTVYSAAKSGILRFTEAFEREMRTYPQIRATVVLPPAVKTHAFASAQRTMPGLMRWNLLLPVSVERIARGTVRGIIAGRRRVYCSIQSYGASLIERFWPWLMDRILLYMFEPPTHGRLLGPAKNSPLTP